MKKFLKTLLIIVLILGSIAGTTYFFFSQIAPKTNYHLDIYNFVTGANSKEFEAKLADVASSSDTAEMTHSNRFNILIEVNKRLNASLLALDEYLLLSDEYDFDNSKISQEYFSLLSAQSKANSVMDEYIAKLPAVDKVIGANDVYASFANYIVKYGNLLNALNGSMKTFKIDKNADLKFSLIEIYANVCIDSYSNISKYGVFNLSNTDNIRFLNGCFSLVNSHIDLSRTSNSDFSVLNNKFISAYNACNKVEFAKNLYSNYRVVTTLLSNQNLSKELVASLYFKQLFEV